jgi:ubiquinone/menaquinone biosynthesis C-methylase UbiE
LKQLHDLPHSALTSRLNCFVLDLKEYYRRRASTYDALYHRDERKEELNEAAKIIEEIFRGKEVLEIACGTGYWTERISQTAKSVFASDINDSMLAIAKSRSYLKNNVLFTKEDFYHLNPEKKFESLFAGFIWSHIPLQELDDFITLMNTYVQSNGRLVFMDNNFVEGSSTPVSRVDGSGNTYQTRKLPDDEEFSIIKNFPSEEFLISRLDNKVKSVNFIKLKYWWIINYLNL